MLIYRDEHDRMATQRQLADVVTGTDRRAATGWLLWTMSGFVDALYPRGTLRSNK